MGRIVVGVDDSQGGRAALAWALDEARLREAEVEAVLAWSYIAQEHPRDADEFTPAYGEDEAQRLLEGIVAEIAGDTAGVAVRAVVVNDLPARALLEQGADADLIVVGSRGRGGIAGLLLGSVSQKVAEDAVCPVVIVPIPHD